MRKSWERLGKLREPRYDHGVFLQRDAFVIVGNSLYGGALETERCKLDGKSIKIQCSILRNSMVGYNNPAMMRVPFNYCPVN